MKSSTEERTFYKVLITSLLLIVALLQSCDDEKNAVLSAQDEITITEKSTISEALAEEEIQYFNEVAVVPGEGGRLAEDVCAAVSKDFQAKTITLDFGTVAAPCVGPYGTERSGKVFILFTGNFDDKVASREITFENYVVNNRAIGGKIKVSGITRNAAGFLSHTRELVDFTVTFPNKVTYTFNGSTTREVIEGEGDGTLYNEKIKVTGSYEGRTSDGKTFTRVIVDPIIASLSCQASGKFMRVKGTVDITITSSQGAKTRTIDYGDGTCDNEVTVIINGKSYTIPVGA